MTQTIINLGTAGALLNGQNGSTAGVDSNDATFLDWPGGNAGNYVYLPGTDNNFMSAPHDAALDISDDLDLICYCRPTVAAVNTIWRKGTAFNTTTFFLRIDTNGVLRFIQGNGTSNETVLSSAAIPTAIGEAVWIRVTRERATSEIKFFTGNDGVTWTQLGTTQSYSGDAAAFNTGELRLGYTSAASGLFHGDLYRMIVKDGIDGTTVFDADTSVITSGSATSFTALTGQTVTINRSTAGRKSVAVVSPVWLFGTDDFMQVANSDLLNPDVNEEFTVIILHRLPNVTSNQVLMTTRSNSTAASLAGWTIRTSGTPNTRAQVDDGTNLSTLELTPYSVGDLQISGFVLSGSNFIGITESGFTSATTRPAGSQRNSLPLRIGARADTLSNYADMELIAVAVFRRALTATEISRITAYYQARLS
jgi:hypothetical protein